MHRLGLALLAASFLHAGSLYVSSADANWKQWTAVRGAAQADTAVQRDGRPSLRIEPGSGTDAIIRSAPVHLRIRQQYELTGWVRSDGLRVSDTGRSPIAVGAALSMASMPFDVHSESVAGTHDWTRLKLRFTATRAEDSIMLRVAEGGEFHGRAWFEGIGIDEAGGAAGPAKASVKTFGPAYRYPTAGWIYLHIEGKPYERGYQHGFLLAHEIERYLERCASQLDPKSRERAWQNGRIVADALFTRGFDQEIREEMKGIADGAAAAGCKWRDRKVDLIDIVTANTITELSELTSAMTVTRTGLEGLGFQSPAYFDSKRDSILDRCSSFAATGKATRDGHMIVGHTTWWPLTLAEQTNVMLDVQPTAGHRVLMQSYPGGIQSGTDWYQNDAGVILTETTIRQSPFNREGTPVAYRARKAIQYGDNVDKVVEHLTTKNNGLYTNEWIIGDAKNDEIAMIELGTYKTKLWRSSKNEWFGGTEGFYWGCNNAKDLDVRLEYLPDPHGAPEYVSFSPAPRDIKWQQLYREHKGAIDEQFAFLAYITAPLVSNSAMDAKVATSGMAANMMVWAAFGKPNQRERLATGRDRDKLNDGLYPSGYTLIFAKPSEALQSIVSANERERLLPKPRPADPGANEARIDSSQLWRGWLLPATDADLWLTAGSASYYRALSSDHPAKSVDRLRVETRGDLIGGDVPLARLHSEINSDRYARLASHKGALVLQALRDDIGDQKFFALMRGFYEANTTRPVTTAAFRAAAEKAAGKPLSDFFAKWLEQPGVPGDRGGPAYLVRDIGARLDSALIVYGTMADAGANRYAAEQFQRNALDQYEKAVSIKKDFELTETDLRDHDVVFIGRPEANQALARYAANVGLQYTANSFRIDGKDHGSEYESLAFAAANPLNRAHMVLVIAGNSALATVKAAKHDPAAEPFTISQ
jgi:hypothetical protein